MQPNELVKHPYIHSLLDRGAEVYLVGGNVRDRLLGVPHKDHDLLVRHLPVNDLLDLLKKFGSVSTVGKSFGIIKFRSRENPDSEIDFSLPRTETSTGEHHRDFEVDFNPNLPVAQDLARRDFTINAMAYNIQTGEITDPFGGRRDLQNLLLRQVFKEAFIEDPLRLMRAIQFTARFNLTIEEETLESMKANAHRITTVSKERIIEELRKLFLALKPSLGFDIMRDVGVLEPLFPFIHQMIGIKQPKKKNEDVYVHTMKVLDASRSATELKNPGDMDLMFAALLHDAGKPKTYRKDPVTGEISFYAHQIVSRGISRQWLKNYKATTIGLNIPKVLNLVDNHMFQAKPHFTDKAIRRFINKVGPDDIMDLIDLRIADKKGGRYPDSMMGIIKLRNRIQEELDKKPPMTPKDLAVTGHDIMALGIKAGPIIGKIQKFLVEKVLDDPELNKKEILEKMILENFKDEK